MHTHARNFTRLGGRARNHPPTHATAPTQAPVCVRSFPRKTLGIYGHSWPSIVRGNAGVFKLSRGEKVTHEWGHAVLRGLLRTSPPWGRAARKLRTRRRERPCARASRLPCLLRCEIRPRFMRGLNAAYAGAAFAGASCGRDSLRPASYPSTALSRRRKRFCPRSWARLCRCHPGRGDDPQVLSTCCGVDFPQGHTVRAGPRLNIHHKLTPAPAAEQGHAFPRCLRV